MKFRRLRRFLPASVMDRARLLKKRLKRRDWEKRVDSGDAPHVSYADVVTALRELGVVEGRDIIVHSALSTIGLVEGGPDTILRALREVVGDEATILMPCYAMKQNMLDTMRGGGVFDVANDESTMGKITRLFRVMPGTLRSGHPTHSVAANGPRAEAYTSSHHQSGSPCGPGSPFRLLSENRGDILCIGSGVGKVTSHHTIEDLVPDFPVEVYLPEALSKPVRFPDGTESSIEVRVHDPRLAAGRIDNHAPREQEILRAMRDAGIVREGRLGAADCHLFGAHDLDELHRQGLETGRTIYTL